MLVCLCDQLTVMRTCRRVRGLVCPVLQSLLACVQFDVYRTSQSGAYLFRPNPDSSQVRHTAATANTARRRCEQAALRTH